MSHHHLTEVRPGIAVDIPVLELDEAPTVRSERQTPKPLRYAVGLTDPQGKELFRKQFSSSVEADGFARATAELCPDYKVSSVDRIDGFAYELKGQAVTITASSSRDSGSGKRQLAHPPV